MVTFNDERVEMKNLMVFLMAFLMLFSIACGDESKSEGEGEKKAPEKAEKKYEKRQANNPEIAIETDYGTMKLEMFRDVAPAHVDSMLARIKDGFYNGLTFHRVIDGFMIQGGDPKGNGTGNAGYFLPAEFSDVPHLEGTLSMARGQDPNSASSQFFICLAPQPYLNKQYTVFGQLMDGNDVLHKIGKVETVAQGREKSKPAETIFIRKMVILKDIAGKKAESSKE
jgi:cyclophilin family peptidyl-prolyl cis-trans isomerase